MATTTTNQSQMIELRDRIDNTLIDEMRIKYPAKGNKNGVVYKLGLNYITISTDFLQSVEVRQLIREHGHAIITLYVFIRGEMCREGYYVRYDGIYLNDLIEKAAFGTMLTPDDIRKMLTALIESNAFIEIEDATGVLTGKYLTCYQQIYNFEMANAKRRLNRATTKRNREKEKTEPEQEKPLPVPEGFLPFDDEDDPFGLTNP